MVPISPYPHQHWLFSLVIFKNSHLNGMKCYVVVLIHIFLTINDVEHLFMCCLAICRSFFFLLLPTYKIVTYTHCYFLQNSFNLSTSTFNTRPCIPGTFYLRIIILSCVGATKNSRLMLCSCIMGQWQHGQTISSLWQSAVNLPLWLLSSPCLHFSFPSSYSLCLMWILLKDISILNLFYFS